MQKVQILDFNSFASYEQTESASLIITTPLVFYSSATSYSGLTVRRGLETVELVTESEAVPSTPTPPVTPPTGEEGTEVAAAADETVAADKVYVNSSNQLVFVIDLKKGISSACEAREYIVGFIVSYPTSRVVYSAPSNAATYNMVVERGADDVFVSAYKQAALADLVKTIPTLDNTLNVDMTGGYVYKIFRDMTICNK